MRCLNATLKSLLTRFFLLSAIILAANAANAQYTMGGRNTAMGQTHTALSNDTWALFHNPAQMSTHNRQLAFFSIRYYGLRELEDHAALFSAPLSLDLLNHSLLLGFAAGLHTYGFELYRKTQIRTGLSLPLNRFQFGFALCYLHTLIQDYDSNGAAILDIGLTAKMAENFLFGSRISNVFPFATGNSGNNPYPVEMAAGLSWIGIDRLILAFDIVKEAQFPLSFRSGFEVEMASSLYLQGGWTSTPFTWSAGSGIHLSRFQTHLAVQKHDVLGLSPGIEFSFSF